MFCAICALLLYACSDNELIDRAESSEIVTEQQSDKDHNVLNGMTFSPSDDATKAQDARDYVASLGVSSKAQMARTSCR